MVTFIKSTANNIQRRMFIRRTWGGISYTNAGRFLYIFVVGIPADKQILQFVKEESIRHQDILLFDGPDDYLLV